MLCGSLSQIQDKTGLVYAMFVKYTTVADSLVSVNEFGYLGSPEYVWLRQFR